MGLEGEENCLSLFLAKKMNFAFVFRLTLKVKDKKSIRRKRDGKKGSKIV
jgi:hypothetical protein